MKQFGLIILLILFGKTGLLAQVAAVAYHIGVSDESGALKISSSFVDKKNTPLRDNDNKVITDPAKIKYPTEGGKIIIKNEGETEISIRLKVEKEDGTFLLLTSTLPIAADGQKEFAFDGGGMLQGNADYSDENWKNGNVDDLVISVNGTKDIQLKGAVIDVKKDDEEKEAGKKIDCSRCDDMQNLKVYKKRLNGLVYYDFECRTFYKKVDRDTFRVIPGRNSIKPRDGIQLKIVNINKYLYDVGIVATNLDDDSPVPPLLKQLFLGDTSGLMGRLLSSFSSGSKTGIQAADSSKLKNKYDAFIAALKKFNEHYGALKEKRMDAFSVCFRARCCEDDAPTFTRKEIITELSELRIALSDLQMTIREDGEMQQLKAKHQTTLAKAGTCDKSRRSLDSVSIKLKVFEGKELTALSDPDKKNKKALDSLTQVYAKDTMDCIQNGTNLRAEENELRFYNSLAELALDLPEENEVLGLWTAVNNIRPDDWAYLSDPIQITGNRFELAISVQPKDSTIFSKWNIKPLYGDSVYYDIPITWKPLISFSSGSFISFSNYLQNKTYDWQPVPNSNKQVTDSSRYILMESGYTLPPMGFAAFINAEVKFARSFGVGISAGAGLTIESNPRMAYLGGASLFFGDLRQFCLTGGLIGMQVNRLNNNFDVVVQQGIQYKQPATLGYYKEFLVGGFFSVTYTPFTNSRRPILKSLSKKTK